METTIQGLKSTFRVSGFGCRVSKNQCVSSYQKCFSVPEVKVALCFEILGHTGLVRRNRLDRGVATHSFASSRWTGRVSIDGWSILVLGQVHESQAILCNSLLAAWENPVHGETPKPSSEGVSNSLLGLPRGYYKAMVGRNPKGPST